MAFCMNTLNSRMIVDLLMKNAAKYDDEAAEKECKLPLDEETVLVKKRKNSIDDKAAKKKKKTKHVDKNDGSFSVTDFKTKVKTENFQYKEIISEGCEYKEIKGEGCEYTEMKFDTKVNSDFLDTKPIQIKLKKEVFGTGKELVPAQDSNRKSIMLDLLKNNVAKYKNESVEETYVDETFSVYKRKNTIDDKGAKKKKKTKFVDKKSKHLHDDGSFSNCEFKNKVKTEGCEYTEIKFDFLDTKSIKIKFKPEDFGTAKELVPEHNSYGKSIILDLLKNNVAKYEDVSLEKTDEIVSQYKEKLSLKKRSNINDKENKKKKKNSLPETKYFKREFKPEDLLDIKPTLIDFKTVDGGNDITETKQLKAKIEDIKNESYDTKYGDQMPVESTDNYDTMMNPLHNEKSTQELEDLDNNSNSESIKKIRMKKTGEIRRKWTNEEDQVLLEAMDNIGVEIDLHTLSQKLKRSFESLRTRIHILKNGSLSREHRLFTLREDQFLMDAALNQLSACPLEQLRLSGHKFLEAQLGRPGTSCYQRWEVHLKPWLLQHFSGTLNLDTRRMIANYVAEHFQDVDSVDWESVARKPKFAGHSTVSLRFIFFNSLFRGTKNSMPEGSKVTLKDVADYTNAKLKDEKIRRIKPGILERQKNVINYFEQHVKKHGIVNFKVYSK